jgi:hypothetical protein
LRPHSTRTWPCGSRGPKAAAAGVKGSVRPLAPVRELRRKAMTAHTGESRAVLAGVRAAPLNPLAKAFSPDCPDSAHRLLHVL